ncbi:MAG: hypothetical protein ACRCYV_04105 [Aeromonas sp.]
MSDITLDNILLPDDLDWPDEFAWSPVWQSITPTLTGALIVEESAQAHGRPITLVSESTSWCPRATVEALYNLAARVNAPMTLRLRGQNYRVIWRRDAGGFTAKQLYRLADPDGHFPYEITLNLLEVAA